MCPSVRPISATFPSAAATPSALGESFLVLDEAAHALFLAFPENKTKAVFSTILYCRYGNSYYKASIYQTFNKETMNE